MSVNRTTTNPILTTKNHTAMKKLLVILILLVHYSTMLILFPIDIVFIILQKGMEFLSNVLEFLSNVLERVCWYYEDYILKPSGRVCEYALQIMRSDKIIKQMKEASNKLKQGKPIE